MFGKIKREQEQQRRDIAWLAEETRKLRDLFTKDRHGTERPKVDILLESLDKVNKNMWLNVNELNKKIGILEKERELEKRREERYMEKKWK